jgi:hypothetical protein
MIAAQSLVAVLNTITLGRLAFAAPWHSGGPCYPRWLHGYHRITQSLLGEFSDAAGTSGLPEDQRFEHFAAFLAISRHLAETFDTRDAVIGSGEIQGSTPSGSS